MRVRRRWLDTQQLLMLSRPFAQLLRKDPEQRLTLPQLLAHPWLTSDGQRPLTLRPSVDLLAVRLDPSRPTLPAEHCSGDSSNSFKHP